MVMEPMGHLVRAFCTLLAMFAAMCPATSSSLGIVVLLLEILDFEAISPCTVPVSRLTKAIVAAEEARLLASAKQVEINRFDFITLSNKASRDLYTSELSYPLQPGFR